jgi:hypothetical protein
MNEIFPITLPTLTTAGVPTDAEGSLTTWIYFPNGQLQQKQDHETKGATYTYTPGGRLEFRTWERAISATDSTKVKTEYGYTQGLLTTVTYNALRDFSRVGLPT